MSLFIPLAIFALCMLLIIPAFADTVRSNVKNTGGCNNSNVVAFTEDGFYWLYNFMMYTDFSTLDTTYVCAKPECDHTDHLYCDAGNRIPDFQIVDGKLYTVDFDWQIDQGRYLTESNLALGERRKVMEFSHDYMGSFCSEAFEIYRNYVIYLGDFGSVCINRLGAPLEDEIILFEVTEEEAKEEFPIIYEVKGGVPYSWRFWTDDNYFYFMGNYALLGAERTFNSKYANQLYRYDLLTKTCEQVWDLPSSKDVGEWKLEGISTNGWYIKDDYIYYFLTGNGLWRTNLNTGVHENLFQTDVNGTAFFDGEYLYINNSDDLSMLFNGFQDEERVIQVFRMDGTKINTISLKSLYEENEADYFDILGTYRDEFVLQSLDIYNNTETQDIKYYLVNAMTGEIQFIADIYNTILMES